jgi:alpha-galactosidase
LIADYACDWIKLDFNVDPGAGCDRIDHGHGSGDGLFEHIQGYYHTLDRIRQKFPGVVLENCSSGGLRIDLGILRHSHMTFLSDPDWPVHDLQVFWGASTMLAPEVCLHWSFSDWRLAKHPPQTFNPHNPALTLHQLDYYTRIAMLGWPGFSQKLPDLPGWVADRLAYHIRMYQGHIRSFVREGDLYRLTGQPRRDGGGDRWGAFQYSLPNASERSEHLLFVFRLPGSEQERIIRLLALQPERIYQIETLEGQALEERSGKDLMENGLAFSGLLEEDSQVLRVY